MQVITGMDGCPVEWKYDNMQCLGMPISSGNATDSVAYPKLHLLVTTNCSSNAGPPVLGNCDAAHVHRLTNIFTFQSRFARYLENASLPCVVAWRRQRPCLSNLEDLFVLLVI
eukprot:3723773-Amphidinium_carterae.1